MYPGKARDPRRVIFLDVDGVLNCETTPPFDGTILTGVDCEMIRKFWLIVATTGATVVLSSSWRWSADLCEELRAAGVRWDSTTTTNWDHQGGERHRNIQRWLDENPGVHRFVVLDDDEDAKTDGGLFIRTDWRVGLTVADAEAAIHWLNQ